MPDLTKVVLPFAAFFSSQDKEKAKIDNFPFRLHYKFTSGFFFMATALLSLSDMFGKEIACFGPDGTKAAQAINQYCWVSGTYTVPGREGIDPNTPGIARGDEACSILDVKGNKTKSLLWDNDNWLEFTWHTNTSVTYKACKRSHLYYQWVPFVLVFQGILFHLPHFLWKHLEEGKMKSISRGMRSGNTEKDEARGDDADRNVVISNIAKFVAKQNRTSGHFKYAASFMFCKILCLLNIVFNIWLLNRFFNGGFLSIGPRWLYALNDPNRHLVLTDIFPRMSMCEWKQHGTGGSVEIKNFVCILSTNIATEKVFIIIWFWFIILFVITLLAIGYYCMLFCNKDASWRNHFLSQAFSSTKTREFQASRSESLRREEEGINQFLKDLPACNFFFLYLLSQNVDYLALQKIVTMIVKCKKDKDSGLPGYRTSMKSKRLNTQMSVSSDTSCSSISALGAARKLESLTPQVSVAGNLMDTIDNQGDRMEMEMKETPVVPMPSGKQ